jgi:hypothetical protein
VQFLGDIETLEQDGGVALGGVAVLVADDAFQSPRRMPSWSVRSPCVQLLALFERAPQPRVAHDDGVDGAEAVEGVLILAQHADFFGVVTVPRCGASSPVSSFMKVDLPAPFGPVRP